MDAKFQGRKERGYLGYSGCTNIILSSIQVKKCTDLRKKTTVKKYLPTYLFSYIFFAFKHDSDAELLIAFIKLSNPIRP